MTPTIAGLREDGVLGPLDVHFAHTLGRLAHEERPLVLLAAALASRHVGLGHVCLDLRVLAATPQLASDGGEPVTEIHWPDPERWLDQLRSSPLVDSAVSGEERRPLVLDDAGRLYLRRYFEHEDGLARAILARAAQEDASLDDAALETALDRLFPPPGGVASGAASGAPTAGARRIAVKPKPAPAGQLTLGFGSGEPVASSPQAPPAPAAATTSAPGTAEVDMQRVAARTAATRRLCVISGGPGTGKTSTVVKILALLVEQRAKGNDRPLRALLLAPTGKAAMRLSEAIQRAKSTLACSDAIRAAIPEEASTIHRALGSIDGSSTRFRHDRLHPLRADVVLVDEASMVDLALMNRLVDAVPDTARLILLGDKDQLASVEAGAVLGELCGSASARRAHDAPLATSIVELTRSYRYAMGSGIEALARAINAGDAAGALAILDDARFPDVERITPSSEGALSDALRAAALAGFRPYLDESDPQAQLRALERFRILCSHRHGPYGVGAANADVEALLAAEGVIERRAGATYRGRPIIVTRNDYQLQLFNGDVGVIVHQGDRRLAFFLAADGTPRLLSPARLPPHETVFAMTVHKSQGSEFDRVAVLLGDRSSPLLTRELLYTAVTRARRAVRLHATAEVLMDAIARPIERASGLRDALWERQ